jgi:AAA+ superfamily predicted ATPase
MCLEGDNFRIYISRKHKFYGNELRQTSTSRVLSCAFENLHSQPLQLSILLRRYEASRVKRIQPPFLLRMPPAFQPQLRSAARNIVQQSSKSIRRPSKRKLHQSLAFRASEPPPNGGESGPGPFGQPVAVTLAEFKRFLGGNAPEEPQRTEGKEGQVTGSPEGDEPPSRPPHLISPFHGSALRRRLRANGPKDTQRSSLSQAPEWFLDWNVQLAEERRGSFFQDSVERTGSTQESENTSNTEPPVESAETTPRETNGEQTASIVQHTGEAFEAQLRELEIIARGHLRLSTADEYLSRSPGRPFPHFILSHSGTDMKNSIPLNTWRDLIEDLTAKLDCDLLVLDAQDIGELIASASIGDDITSEAMTMSYEVSEKIQKLRESDQRARSFDTMMSGFGGNRGALWKDDDLDEGDEFEEIPMDGQHSPFGTPMMIGKPIAIDITKMLESRSRKQGASRRAGDPPSFMSALFDSEQSKPDPKHDHHIFSGVVNNILSAAAVKRSKNGAGATKPDVSIEGANSSDDLIEEASVAIAPNSNWPSVASRKKLIIYVQAIHAIEDHALGQQFLSELYEQVRRRRSSGQEQIVIGAPPFIVNSERARWTEGGENASDRVLLTPPEVAPQDVSKVTKIRVQDATATNYRNLRTMLQAKWSTEPWESFNPRSSTFLEDVARTASMPETISPWRSPYVQRLAAVIWGTLEQEPDKNPSITEAVAVLDQSDRSKNEWVRQRTRDRAHRKDNPEESRLSRIRLSATKHEKALLAGVIEPSKISVTFKDVHAPFETIEAIQTMTTLSLVRPEAFRYGVLASDRLPGLLLYGPPGTGKTLLAKAVAKESGATVLSVSSAQLNDMYVGEGEKNVAALFSLAKKLTPCIIFLDEADAIFSARGNRGSRVNHRELLNQFLTEWDGMSNDASGAFIMVATNRPMDLDDAVLRRLPRRLLVDLPTESDRLAILKIHLRDEVLADDVDLTELAKKTPFYSGSDLKNLAVAAALECVREENEAAKKHVGEEAYKHAEKRTLTGKHFEKAVGEISASISEDMSSLRDIKKFDEQYGDKRGKKKRSARWGFSTAAEADKVLDTVKVRS